MSLIEVAHALRRTLVLIETPECLTQNTKTHAHILLKIEN